MTGFFILCLPRYVFLCYNYTKVERNWQIIQYQFTGKSMLWGCFGNRWHQVLADAQAHAVCRIQLTDITDYLLNIIKWSVWQHGGLGIVPVCRLRRLK